LSADQVCARDFNPKLTRGPERVAYQCQTGARWACCDPTQVGSTTEQPLQNLGTCERYPDDDELLLESKKYGFDAPCISDGGLGPYSRGVLSADQVCARDFNPKLTRGPERVAYQCQTGARWACCDPTQVGSTTEQPLQNLGTCERYPDDDEFADEYVLEG